MKLKKIKYLFLLSSSITIIPAIAMSCDKNEEPGNNTGTTDKQVTPPIKFLRPGNGGEDSKTLDNDNPTIHANENLIEELKTNPLQRVEGITDQQIYDKIFSKFTNETKIRGLQVYNVDNNVFIGISGGGNDVDNKLFKAKKDDFYNLLTDWDNKDAKNIQKRFNHSEWDNENKTLIFRYKIKGNKEDQVYEQRFTLNVELKEFNPPKKEQPSNTEKPTTSTEKYKPIEAPVVENADIKVNPLQKITEVSDQKIYDKIQSMLKSKNNIFPGIQKYTDKTVKFFGILSGSNKDDNKLFTYTNPDFDAKIIPATENTKKNNNRFPESTWDEATKTLVFKYKIKDDTDNTIYEQSFKLEIQSQCTITLVILVKMAMEIIQIHNQQNLRQKFLLNHQVTTFIQTMLQQINQKNQQILKHLRQTFLNQTTMNNHQLNQNLLWILENHLLHLQNTQQVI
ncbi:hypothetical protein NW733_02060 [Mycoplasmopsis felis]|uniref:hypothetical protein n=1 Tax=Mycoplasmopsis felis TaxID=33923 RepID=UPI0021DFCB1E|nr:hypothetical protein [Mycoplasmopsis felis]MCU9931500.1 hypothetical protein [Mycoplasmopsis felis]